MNKNKGHPCHLCNKFYRNEPNTHTCRHKDEMSTTPPEFWRVDFPSSQEILDKKLMLTDDDPLPELAKPNWMKEKEKRKRVETEEKSNEKQRNEVINNESASLSSKDESSDRTNDSVCSPPAKRKFFSETLQNSEPAVSETSTVLATDTSHSSTMTNPSSATSSLLSPSEDLAIIESISSATEGMSEEMANILPTNVVVKLDKRKRKKKTKKSHNFQESIVFDCILDGNTMLLVEDRTAVPNINPGSSQACMIPTNVQQASRCSTNQYIVGRVQNVPTSSKNKTASSLKVKKQNISGAVKGKLAINTSTQQNTKKGASFINLLSPVKSTKGMHYYGSPHAQSKITSPTETLSLSDDESDQDSLGKEDVVVLSDDEDVVELSSDDDDDGDDVEEEEEGEICSIVDECAVDDPIQHQHDKDDSAQSQCDNDDSAQSQCDNADSIQGQPHEHDQHQRNEDNLRLLNNLILLNACEMNKIESESNNMTTTVEKGDHSTKIDVQKNLDVHNEGHVSAPDNSVNSVGRVSNIVNIDKGTRVDSHVTGNQDKLVKEVNLDNISILEPEDQQPINIPNKNNTDKEGVSISEKSTDIASCKISLIEKESSIEHSTSTESSAIISAISEINSRPKNVEEVLDLSKQYTQNNGSADDPNRNIDMQSDSLENDNVSSQKCNTGEFDDVILEKCIDLTSECNTRRNELSTPEMVSTEIASLTGEESNKSHEPFIVSRNYEESLYSSVDLTTEKKKLLNEPSINPRNDKETSSLNNSIDLTTESNRELNEQSNFIASHGVTVTVGSAGSVESSAAITTAITTPDETANYKDTNKFRNIKSILSVEVMDDQICNQKISSTVEPVVINDSIQLDTDLASATESKGTVIVHDPSIVETIKHVENIDASDKMRSHLHMGVAAFLTGVEYNESNSSKENNLQKSKKKKKRKNVNMRGMAHILSGMGRDKDDQDQTTTNEGKTVTSQIKSPTNQNKINEGLIVNNEDKNEKLNSSIDKLLHESNIACKEKCFDGSKNLEEGVVDDVTMKQFDVEHDNDSTIEEDISMQQYSENFDVCYSSFVEYNFNEPPIQVGLSSKEFLNSHENHLRGCLWSPDGKDILTNSDDNILRIFSLPDDILEKTNQCKELEPLLRIGEGETIYDVAWYPYMNAFNPDTCCFLSTSRDHPIHLWDSCTGRVRCSYRAFDQMDELASANSVAFNLDGSKIYAGFNKTIRIFDSARPGRDFIERSTVAKKNCSRKGKKRPSSASQTGIISSIAFSQEFGGLYALGSFSKTVGLYETSTDKLLFLLTGQLGGVTQVKFTPDGSYLFSGGRKDPELVCWDLRNTTIPLFKLLRHVSTNQRIQFDMDRSGSYLFSGSTNNSFNVWDLNYAFNNVKEEVVSFEPTHQFVAHSDAVNAVSVHPTQPLLATTSGQRHFILDDSDSETDAPSNNYSFDNSLRVWKV